MIPRNHRVVPLHAAIAEFDLETPFRRNGGFDTLETTFGDDNYDHRRQALVFDGDTRFDQDFDAYETRLVRSGLHSGTLTPFEELLEQVCIVVVNGSLQAGRITVNECRALFVFGDVRCDRFEFWEFDLAWIAGDLHAHQAVLAAAGHDDAWRAERVGRDYACVRGSMFSPRVQTWFMHLGHLRWREDSGDEVREDVEYEGREHLWKTDPIW